MRRFDFLLTALMLPVMAGTGACAASAAPVQQSTPGDRLLAAARERLAQALAPLKGDVLIEPAAAGMPLELPAGRLEFRARPLPQALAPSKHMLVWVDVMADGRFIRAVPVSFDVSVFVPGWALKQPAMAGSRIAVGAVEPHEVDVAAADFGGEVVRRQDDTFKSPGEVVLLRANLRPGEVLTWKNAVPVPSVARGEPATLRLHGDAIEVESRVQVLQDGYPGQTVKVKAPGATGAIVATVAGPGMVEAQE